MFEYHKEALRKEEAAVSELIAAVEQDGFTVDWWIVWKAVFGKRIFRISE